MFWRRQILLASLSPPIFTSCCALVTRLRYEQGSRKAERVLLAVTSATKRLEKGRYEQYLSSNAKQKKSCYKLSFSRKLENGYSLPHKRCSRLCQGHSWSK